jgi:hypothetical protein
MSMTDFIAATQNEKAVKILRLGTIIPTLLHFILRLLFRRSSLPPSKGSLAIYIITYLPTFFITRYLEKIGTTKRDTAGTLISSGEDLNQPGITEWCFDIIYVTCEIIPWYAQIFSLELYMRRGVSGWKWRFRRVVLVFLAGGEPCRTFVFIFVLTVCIRFLSMLLSKYGIVSSRRCFWQGPHRPQELTSRTIKRH